MTDYNDGNWHGWNGGECPVHPKSVVDVRLFGGGRAAKYDSAGLYSWTHSLAFSDENIVKFRVTKPYVEPPKLREFWIVETDGPPRAFYNEWIAKKYAGDSGFDVIHVREVIEE